MSGARLWEPTTDAIADANVSQYLEWLREHRGREFADYESLWRWSTTALEEFWQSIWDYYEIGSSVSPNSVLVSKEMPGARWFPGARLNYAEQVLARAEPRSPAIISVAEDREPISISVDELAAQVTSLAVVLRSYGVGRGDRVAAYVGNRPEAIVAMLAVTSLGAVWTVCAPDFGIRGVLDRFTQVEPKVLIAVDGYRFGGREYERMNEVRELQAAMPTITRTILIRALDPSRRPPSDLDAECFDELIDGVEEPHFEQMDFEDPLWILYSSGTTGVPKGIVQSHGGILIEHLKAIGLMLDLRRRDRFFFYSSTSWMAWNYLVGGLLHGATIVVYDGSPAYPDAAGSWRVAAQTAATTFGTGAAYVTASANAGLHPAEELDLSQLRTVIPTGSPLPPGDWIWLDSELDPRTRIDPIAGGTDVCTIFVGGSPLLPVELGEIPCRCLGVAVDVFDPEGRPIRDEVGEFVVTEPMPSMPIYLWNDPDRQRYRETYFANFPGVWRQGDWAMITARGTVSILGRSDSTLNRGGVRIGSAEIYATVEAIAEVQDSLVLGVELADGRYHMPLFVVPDKGAHLDEELCEKIRRAIRAELSPRHVPDEIVEAPMIPRTLTGKKLEVPIKRILQGVPVGEAVALGAIDAPEALEWYADFAQDLLAGDRP